MHILNTILTNILGIVFPVKCLSCGKSGVDFCFECLSDSPNALRETATWIFPIYDYRHPPIKKALWLLKYDGKKVLANVFAEIMYAKIVEELSELSIMENFRNPLLIPIPLSKKRHRERGYNQAELICRELVSLLRGVGGEAFTLESRVLIKIKDTEHQARIRDRRARLKNLTDSFGIKNAELVKGRNIILIDDITTTGATLNEARKILKSAGAKKVIAFTVAH